MTTRFVVIALDDSPRVGDFFSQKGADVFEVFKAVDGRKGEGFAQFDQCFFEEKYGRAASAAEIGCAVSHYSVLKDFAQSDADDDAWIVVAEDDAVFSPNFHRVVEAICQPESPWEHVVLADPFGVADKHEVGGKSEAFTQLSFLARAVCRVGDVKYQVGSYTGVLWGAGLYAMKKSSAQKYEATVKKFGKLHWLADDHEYVSRIAGITTVRLRPNLASWRGDSSVRDLSDVSPSYNTHSSRVGRVKGKLAIRTRISHGRNVVAAGLRDCADRIEKRLT